HRDELAAIRRERHRRNRLGTGMARQRPALAAGCGLPKCDVVIPIAYGQRLAIRGECRGESIAGRSFELADWLALDPVPAAERTGLAPEAQPLAIRREAEQQHRALWRSHWPHGDQDDHRVVFRIV